MAKVHGAVNLVGGAWPLLHRRSFEAVFGPKSDRWLMYTVAGLLISVGYTQLRASTPEDWLHARRVGVLTASTLLLIDVVHVPRGVIRKTYLLDAVAEAALIAGWASVSPPTEAPTELRTTGRHR
ncbi:hypothetical protein AAII07_01020 [Microvirga sp. 0TCS3.31]